MDFNTIPLVRHLGIHIPDDNQSLGLPFSDHMGNHLGTMHAGAQFTLAETASGYHLMQLFPELVNKVIPVLRNADIKFKRPVNSALQSQPSVSEEALLAFRDQFERKGRGGITVKVNLVDENDKPVAEGSYHWFVQRIE